MLEIIAIIFVGKSIRAMIEDKGLKPWKYILLMIALWIGFEIMGGILGAFLFGGMMSYLFALAGAAIGGYLGYFIAENAEPKEVQLD